MISDDLFGDDAGFEDFDLDGAVFAFNNTLETVSSGQQRDKHIESIESTKTCQRGKQKHLQRENQVGNNQVVIEIKDEIAGAAAEGLNVEQYRAVHSDFELPLLIQAGAGSGKTMTMIKRMEAILKSKKCKPHQLLAWTFTRNAAQEMRERMTKAVKEDASKINISTFHAFCLKICRTYLHLLPGKRIFLWI